MRAVVVLLFGMTATLTGAFTRSCQSIPSELLQSWCGTLPRQFVAAAHQHCVGCTLIATGVGLMALSPLLHHWWAAPARRRIFR